MALFTLRGSEYSPGMSWLGIVHEKVRWAGRVTALACFALASVVTGGAAQLSAAVTYNGMCDASAAVSFGTNYFVVANDEDNVIRIYRRHPGGAPVATVDVAKFLVVQGKSPETDIEGSARVGNRIYWITSHGRNAKGKNSPDRHRFFAMDILESTNVPVLVPTGRPYHRLLLDFALDSRLLKYGLVSASRLAPKMPGGLNIEGLTARPDGSLVIGFRNPIPHGKALLLPLLNPAGLIANESAKFGDPIELDLHGLGVRSMGYENGRYLVIAGPSGARGSFQLFNWTGDVQSAPTVVEGITFPGFSPEGMTYEGGDGREQFFILSDDGTLQIDGVDCKRLKDPMQRRFRGFTLTF